MFRYGDGPWLSDIPTTTQLHKLTINQLIRIAKGKRSIKHPLKSVLVGYVKALFDQSNSEAGEKKGRDV